MAKRKKRQFHCERCGNPCMIYKKGKAHRVLVCPVHGVIATNPFSLGGAASGAGLGATIGSVVPGIGTGIGAAAGGLIGAFTGGDGEKPTPPRDRPVSSPTNRFTTEERVSLALR